MAPVGRRPRIAAIVSCAVAASCLHSRVQAFSGVFVVPKSTTTRSLSASSAALSGLSRPSRGPRNSMLMQLESREEDVDFEMTVDWDEELRKLNAGELDEKLKARDRDMRKLKTKGRNGKLAAKKRKAQDADPADWVKAKAREAQKAAQQTSYQMRGAIRKAPRWRQLSQDWRFWMGAVVAVSLILSIISASGRSQDLLVMQQQGEDVFGLDNGGMLGASGMSMDSVAFVALLGQAAAQATSDVASQLVDSGAATVFA